MRSSIVIFFAASLASAATIFKRQTTVPACAQTCFDQSPSTPCQPTDTACLCLNPNFITALTQCVTSTCSEADQQAAATAAPEICKAAGIDFTNPLPACAATCDTNTTSATCPAPADPNATPDVACYCKDTTYIQTIDSCFKSSCTGQDLTNAEAVGSALCRAYGVDISSIVGAA
ncbi:hypothetical protein FS837_005627 [Tulasnella sp. UAMH 9824]|nr:hypothetical protein FS837_005627 [Tulasnella sp. UAMH 9824]